MRDDDRILYYIWLTLINGIGVKTQHKLLDAIGDPRSIYNASEEDLAEAGISRKRRELLLSAKHLEHAYHMREECAKKGLFIITNADAVYPGYLRTEDDMPILLYGKGNIALFHRADSNEAGNRIGVVGARRCSRQDRDECISLIERLAAEDPETIIISGAAKGIDGYSHTAAIKNGLRTIAFVGTGPDLCYPPEHMELYKQIAEHGVILSEYPPGTAANRYHFPMRNRLIAGWSDQLYVIGAGRKSGTEYTVEFFRRYHGEAAE